MLLRIFSIVFPVFAIAALGYLYGRRKRPSMTVANQLNMDIFLPALVFSALASKDFDPTQYGELALAGLLIVVGSGVLAWPFARALGIQVRTLVPTMMFNNAGNMGLPLALLAFGEEILAAAIVLFVIEVSLHFSLGLYILDHRTHLMRMLRMPVIIATILGVGFSATGLALPAPVQTMIKMLGDISIPLLLFALGVRLTDVSLKEWRVGVLGAILCPLTGLAMAWLILQVLDLPPAQQGLLIVFGALPPAVLNYIVAEQYEQEPEKVASIVMLGNLGALAIMPIALALALR